MFVEAWASYFDEIPKIPHKLLYESNLFTWANYQMRNQSCGLGAEEVIFDGFTLGMDDSNIPMLYIFALDHIPTYGPTNLKLKGLPI